MESYTNIGLFALTSKGAGCCLRLRSAAAGLLSPARPAEAMPPQQLTLAFFIICLLLCAGKIMTVLQNARSQGSPYP